MIAAMKREKKGVSQVAVNNIYIMVTEVKQTAAIICSNVCELIYIYLSLKLLNELFLQLEIMRKLD